MPIRAAIYARFSSELQNERSCDDQIEYCAVWAKRQDLFIVDTYRDEGVSGASALNRPGLAGMMRGARAKRFDVLICEDLDRLTRKQSDLHRMRDELTFLGIRLMTVSDGTITAMHAGLKGLMSEMFLTELANKTRRGLQARIAAGASGGGKSYGYDSVPGMPGEQRINEREAAIVRRIFAEYVAGKTPRQIAGALNAEGVPSPRGGKWNASTLNGSNARQNGILQNRLYAGELVWNRQRFVKDPSTGRRVSRLNPETEWQRTQVPGLAIVDPQIFNAAGTRKSERSADRGPVMAKPKHFLSGLIKCGCCGASYTIIGRDRLGCTGRRERGDCTNNRTVTRKHVEERVLTALQNHLADPELMAAYVKTYHQQRHELAANKRAAVAGKERRLADLTRGISRIVDAVVDGTASASLIARLSDMETEQAALQEDLASAAAAQLPIELHPAAAGMYRRIIGDLQEHLNKVRAGDPPEALLEKARCLIDQVVLTPGENKKPANLTVHGLLARLLTTPHPDQSEERSPYRGPVVAGARNTHTPTFEIAA